MCEVTRDKLIAYASAPASMGFQAVRQEGSTVINGHAEDQRAPEAGPATPRHLFKVIRG
jgi:hypothetical protein